MMTRMLIVVGAITLVGCASLTNNQRAGLNPDGTRMSSEQLVELELRYRGDGGDRHGRIQAFSIDHAYADAFWRETAHSAGDFADSQKLAVATPTSSGLAKDFALIDLGGKALGLPGTLSPGVASGMFLLGAITDDSDFVRSIGMSRLQDATDYAVAVIASSTQSNKEDIEATSDIRRTFLTMANWLEKVGAEKCAASIFVDPKGIYYQPRYSYARGYSHYRQYRCQNFPKGAAGQNVEVLAERVYGKHPLAKTELFNIFGRVSFNLLHSKTEKPPLDAGRSVYIELRDHLPDGWVVVFPGMSATGKKQVYVGDRQRVMAFDPPSDI